MDRDALKMDIETRSMERLSALADGELGAEGLPSAIDDVIDDESARQAWWTYHLIGDVLREGAGAPVLSTQQMAADVRRRIALEGMTVAAANPAQVRPAPREAANDGVFRWRLVAGVCALAAALSLTWSLSGRGGNESAVLADGRASMAAPEGPGSMIRDAQLDDLIAAHRRAGGMTGFGASSGFVRNATFEVGGR